MSSAIQPATFAIGAVESSLTCFNMRGAIVLQDGAITYERAEPQFFRGEPGLTHDRLVLPVAWVDCNACDKRFTFNVYPGMEIKLPWSHGGWIIRWETPMPSQELTVLCPSCRSKETG